MRTRSGSFFDRTYQGDKSLSNKTILGFRILALILLIYALSNFWDHYYYWSGVCDSAPCRTSSGSTYFHWDDLGKTLRPFHIGWVWALLLAFTLCALPVLLKTPVNLNLMFLLLLLYLVARPHVGTVYVERWYSSATGAGSDTFVSFADCARDAKEYESLNARCYPETHLIWGW